MLSREQFYLVKVAEECNEIAQMALKCVQFGLEEVKEGQTETNAQRLSSEINDLLLIIRFLAEAKLFNLKFNDENTDIAKQAKVEHYMNKSIKLGKVQK